MDGREKEKKEEIKQARINKKKKEGRNEGRKNKGWIEEGREEG